MTIDKMASMRDVSLTIGGEKFDFTDIQRHEPNDDGSGEVTIHFQGGDALGDLSTVDRTEVRMETPTAVVSLVVKSQWVEWKFEDMRMSTLLHLNTKRVLAKPVESDSEKGIVGDLTADQFIHVVNSDDSHGADPA